MATTIELKAEIEELKDVVTKLKNFVSEAKQDAVNNQRTLELDFEGLRSGKLEAQIRSDWKFGLEDQGRRLYYNIISEGPLIRLE